MKLYSKEILKKEISGLKILLYILPVTITISILYPVLIDINLLEFPYDNARYAYSAIFQGFAAILAIMITAILITLQNIHSQRFSIEERIHQILGSRYPTYIPDTFTQINRDLDNPSFEENFKKYAIGNLTEFTPSQCGLFVHRTIAELKRNFGFLAIQKWHESRLRRIFPISLGVIIVVIIYSLSALIIVPPNPSEIQSIINGTLVQATSDNILQNVFFKLNPIYILIFAVILVLFALMIIMQFMMSILNIWKLKAE